MIRRMHYTDYDDETTFRCERVLITLLGDLGPWKDRVYLAGGLAPRYLIGELPQGIPAHAGTGDVDLVIGLAMGDETPETYRTLQNNLEKSGFKHGDPSFRWTRDVESIPVIVEFLCETDTVEPGRIYRPKGEFTGSKLGAFNVRGAHLVRDDFVVRELEGDRLDGGGRSKVSLRVANLLPFTVLKILAFQDRHENKDAYDLVFTLLNHLGDPRETGRQAHHSPVAQDSRVAEALSLLGERFRSVDEDGPAAYAAFLASRGDEEARDRLRREAVATIREFLAGFRES